MSLDCETYYKPTVLENCMNLASGWADRPMEYNRDPGNKPSHIRCYGLNICVNILNLEVLIPIVMVSEGGAFKR